MHIDNALLSKLERLSMIHIDENKRESTKEQLSEILGFVENIATIEVPQDCFDEELKTLFEKMSQKMQISLKMCFLTHLLCKIIFSSSLKLLNEYCIR